MMCRITQINEENYGYYLPMLPANFAEQIEEDENALMFGIESFGMAAGSVMLRLIGFEAEITWFYVDERYRGRGVGSEGLLHLMELLNRSYDITQIAMTVYAGADEELLHLFDGYPVERAKLPQCTFETTLGWLRSSSKIRAGHKHSITLGELDKKKLIVLCEGLIAHGEDLVEMPIDPDLYLKDQSAIYMEGEKATGALLFRKKAEGIEIALLASFASNAAAVMDMMSLAAEKMNRFGEDTKVLINIVDDRVEKLIRNLFSMDADDMEGFTKSERFTLDLSFLESARKETERILAVWNELKVGKAS